MSFAGTAEDCNADLLLSGSETKENVLDLFRRYGMNGFERLAGSFALALFDRENRKLYLARDSFGTVPLYYYPQPEKFAFATDLNELRKLISPAKTEICSYALAQFLALQYIPGNFTIYQDIAKIPPGMTLCYDLNTKKDTLHCRDTGLTELSSFACYTGTYADACAELREKVVSSVRKNLTPETGVFLSGGLDSSILTAIAAKETGGDIPVYSMGNPDPVYDESRLAAETAAWLGLKKHTVVPFRIPSVSELPVPAELFADSSLIPFSQLCGGVEGCTSMLSGDGADELFLGYDRYRAMKLFRYLPPGLCRLLAPLVPGGGERSAAGRLKRLLETGSQKTAEEKYFSIVSHNAVRRMTGLLNFSVDDFTPETSGNEFDLGNYLPENCAAKIRLGSMDSGLNIRTPFMNPEIAEFALSLPENFKLKGKYRKRILADAFADMLPPGLTARKKRGFGVPAAEWMRSCWKHELYDHLPVPELSCFFNRTATERLIKEHVSGKSDHSYLLYSMLIFSLWLERNR